MPLRVFQIFRAEIICAAILLFLLIYYSIFKVKDKEFFFLKLCCVTLSHVIFEFSLILTMTFWGTIPESTTRILYICFYATAILFVVWFFSYIIRRLAQYRHSRLIRNAGYILLVVCVSVLASMPMNHELGRSVYFEHTLFEYIAYTLFLLYCLICTLMLLIGHKRLEYRVKLVLAPVILIMYLAVVLQAVCPDRYMTGGCLTAICVALFAVLDNPDKDFVQQALWDFTTGLKNRNSYNNDIAEYTATNAKPRRIGLLVVDMNYLKLTNDRYGHIEGDKLIQGAATLLVEHLKTATDIYRLGGDEFVAVYLSPDEDEVAAELESVSRACAETAQCAHPISFAMGYASGCTTDDFHEIFRAADRKMYEDKARIKATGTYH